MREFQQKVFDRCLELEPLWEFNKEGLERIIIMADVHGDGHKRVIVEGKTYLVPIEDIICTGLKAVEVPGKYRREGK